MLYKMYRTSNLNVYWEGGGRSGTGDRNPGPSACWAGALLLSYIASPKFKQCTQLQTILTVFQKLYCVKFPLFFNAPKNDSRKSCFEESVEIGVFLRQSYYIMFRLVSNSRSSWLRLQSAGILTSTTTHSLSFDASETDVLWCCLPLTWVSRRQACTCLSYPTTVAPLWLSSVFFILLSFSFP